MIKQKEGEWKMKKVKVATFNKKGVEIEVQAALGSQGVNLYLVSPNAETHVLMTAHHEKYGWYYAVPNKFGEKTFGLKVPAGKQYIVLTDPSAKNVTKKAKEILEQIEREEAQKEFENLSDDAKITLIFATDCTTIVCENETAGKHEFFKTTKENIHQNLNTDDIEKVLGRKADEVDFDDYVHTFRYEMTFGEYKKLAELADRKVKEAEQKKLEKEKAEKERIEKLFEKARETRKPQIIEQYPVECNDPNEECSIDIVTVYAMPDGTRKITRHHTW